MHSRIIELGDEPILEHERFSEYSVPEWFYHSVADYVVDSDDRSDDVEWFLDQIGSIVRVSKDGESFTFKPKAKQKYFEHKYHLFLDMARELSGISLDAFVGETEYDIGMSMYKLQEVFADKFDFYIYYKDQLKSLDEWIRETDLNGSFYFGGTLDYHF